MNFSSNSCNRVHSVCLRVWKCVCKLFPEFISQDRKIWSVEKYSDKIKSIKCPTYLAWLPVVILGEWSLFGLFRLTGSAERSHIFGGNLRWYYRCRFFFFFCFPFVVGAVLVMMVVVVMLMSSIGTITIVSPFNPSQLLKDKGNIRLLCGSGGYALVKTILAAWLWIESKYRWWCWLYQ